MVSPINNSNNLILIKSFLSSELIFDYQEKLNFNVDPYLSKVDKIHLYKCLDSGYRFYSPNGISGDGAFYKNLEKFDWYYDPWKWEHEVASKFCSLGQRILEVGCGKGSFIKYLEEEKGCHCVGLEVNGKSDSNPVILGESIQDHSINNLEKYDVVACFQVLEHIYEVRDFLNSCVSCLKSGGKLILSVPNNAGFVGKDIGNDLLNMPPHHMGLWDIDSLMYLTKIFPLKFSKAHFEPLRRAHVSWFVDVLERQLFSNSEFLKRLFRKSRLKGLIKRILIQFPKLVKGHTVHVVFVKN